MLNFVQNFKSLISGRIKQEASGLVTETKILNQLNDFKLLLETKGYAFDNFATGFLDTMSSTVMYFPKMFKKDGVTNPDFIAELEKEDFQVLMDSFDQSVNESETVTTFSMVDSNGNVYQLFKVSANGFTGLATQPAPMDESDYLIYCHDGKFYLNGLMKSTGFIRNDQFTTPTTVNSALLDVVEWLDLDPENATIYSMLKSICYHYDCNPGVTIESAFISLRDKLSLSGDTLSEVILNLWGYVSEEGDHGDYGTVGFVGDILSDVLTANTINSAICTLIDFLKKKITEINSLAIMLRDYLSSTRAVIVNFAKGALNSFINYGWYGLAQYIINYIKTPASVSYEDGALTFTDNNGYVPQQYIAGFLGNVVSGVVSAASAIVRTISPILSGVVGLVGRLITLPFDTVAYNLEQTKASFNPATGFVLPAIPCALFQQTFYLNDFARSKGYWVLKEVIDQGTIAYLNVPGGYLLFGSSGSGNETFNVEFHPSYNTYDCYSQFGFSRFTPSTSLVGYTAKGVGMTYHPTARELYDARMSPKMAKDFNYEFTSEGFLTDESDKVMRAVIETNIGLFLYWLYVSSTEDTSMHGYTDYTEIWHWQSPTQPPILHQDEPYYGIGVNSILEMISMCVIYSTGTILSSKPHTWNEIAQFCVNYSKVKTIGYSWMWVDDHQIQYVASDLRSILPGMQFFNYNDDWYYKSIDDNTLSYEINMPKYDSKTFLRWVGTIVASSIILAGATIALTVAVKKWKFRKRAKNTAKVSNADAFYNKCMDEYDESDPTDKPEYHTPEGRAAARQQYERAVFSNNLWANVIGGTKYSKAGYWDATDSGGSVPSEIEDGTFFSNVLSTGDATSENAAVNPATKASDDIYQKRILKLIAGEFADL